MRTQRVNPNGMNPMQMNNMSSMMGMMNNIQRIGKGKRKITVNLDKNNKKFLSKFIEEVKKTICNFSYGCTSKWIRRIFLIT